MTTTTTTSTAPGGVIGLYDAVGNACRYLDEVGLPGRRSAMSPMLVGIEHSILLDGSLAPGAVERALMLIEAARPERTLEDSREGEPWSATQWAATVTLGLYAARLYSAPRSDPQAEMKTMTDAAHLLVNGSMKAGTERRHERLLGWIETAIAPTATRAVRARIMKDLIPYLVHLTRYRLDYAQLAVDLRDLEDPAQSRRVAWEWGWELGIGPRDGAIRPPSIYHPH